MVDQLLINKSGVYIPIEDVPILRQASWVLELNPIVLDRKPATGGPAMQRVVKTDLKMEQIPDLVDKMSKLRRTV